MDHIFLFGGVLGYGEAYWDFVFSHSKVFILHATVHDAAGQVGSHRCKVPSFCYNFGREPTSCVLGQVTGLVTCFYKKLFLPSIFNSVNF